MTSTDDEARTLQEVADHYAQLRALGGVLESRRRIRKYNDAHDAKGRFAKKMGALKATYPEVARNYPRSSGTEMGSIESHTGDVAREWETQISTETLKGISERFGSDVDRLMETAIPLHDIGKPDAIAAGDKHQQHERTVPIMQDVLQKEGFSDKDISLATELINHDLIGPLFRGRGKDTEVAQKLTEKAQKVGMNVQDFATLQLAFYQADAAAYPYITHYMKQEPSGRWTFEHSPTIAAIVALTKPAKKRAWEEVFKYNKAHDDKGRFAEGDGEITVHTSGRVQLPGRYDTTEISKGNIVIMSKKGYLALGNSSVPHTKWVAHVYVKDEFRRQGVALSLYEAGLRAVHKLGLEGIVRGDVPLNPGDLGMADTTAHLWQTKFIDTGRTKTVVDEHGRERVVLVKEPAAKLDEVFKYNKAHDEKGRFATTDEGAKSPQQLLVQRFLERAQGQHRVAHEDYQPVKVTTNPHRTRFVLPDGTRIKPASLGMEHSDAAFEALSYEGHTEHASLTKLMEAGVIRYNKGMGGIQLIGPITEAQANLVADDWNIVYNEGLYVDSVQMKDGKPDFEGSRSRRIDPPFTADALRYWINHPEVQKFEEAQHPRDKEGKFTEASATETARQKRVEAAIPPIEGGHGPARAEWERLIKKSMAATDAYVDAKEHHYTVIARMRQKYGPDEGNWADDLEYQASLAQRATAQRADIEADQAIVRQAPHMQKEVVRNLVTDAAEKMGLDASIIDVVHKDPPEFDVGDKHYTEAGHYDPNTQRVEINAKAADYANAPAVKGLTAHELTHAVYHQLRRARIAEYQQIQSLTVAERKRLFEEPEPNLRGAPKPEAMEELRQRFPATALWGEYRGEGALATAESKALGERMDTEDGHSSYAKSYWTPEYLNSPRPLTHQNAENETLAEVTRWWTYPKSWQDDTVPDPQSPWVVLAKKMHEWAAEREDRRKHPVLKFAQVFKFNQAHDAKGRFTTSAEGKQLQGDEDDARTFFHGTAQGRLDSILTEGLSVGHAGEAWPTFSHRDSVYMTTNEEDALRWARMAAERLTKSYAEPTPIAIIKILIPADRVADLKVDENFGEDASERQFKGSVPPEWIVEAKLGTPADDPDYIWKDVPVHHKAAQDGQIVYVVVVLQSIASPPE